MDELINVLKRIMLGAADDRGDSNTMAMASVLELIVSAYKLGQRHTVIQLLKEIEARPKEEVIDEKDS